MHSSSRASGLAAILCCLVPSVSAWGQDAAAKPSTMAHGSVKSYATALQVLEAGIHALGGGDVLRAMDDFAMTETGSWFARHQSVRVDPPWDRTASTNTVFIDTKKRRYISEFRDPERGGKEVVHDGQAFFVDPMGKTIYPMGSDDIPRTVFAHISRLPHLLLAHVRDERAATLRYLGEESFENRSHRLVSFSNADGMQLAMWF